MRGDLSEGINMYSPFGSVSGVVHLIAKRPYISALVATVAITTALATTPPVPPAPLTPSLPEVVAEPQPSPVPSEPCEIEILQPGVKPHQIGNCVFHDSAAPYKVLGHTVDKVCLAQFEVTILYLKSHPKDLILLEGNSLTGHGGIAMSRAWNLKMYLVNRGMDPKRIQIKRGVKRSRVVELIDIPEGV
jgi:hypothetical protein